MVSFSPPPTPASQPQHQDILERLVGFLEAGSDSDGVLSQSQIELIVEHPEIVGAHLADWAHSRIESGRAGSMAFLLLVALRNLLAAAERTPGGIDLEKIRAGLMRTANSLWRYCPDEEVGKLEDELFELFQGGEGVRNTRNQLRAQKYRGAQEVPDYVVDAMESGASELPTISRPVPPELMALSIEAAQPALDAPEPAEVPPEPSASIENAGPSCDGASQPVSEVANLNVSQAVTAPLPPVDIGPLVASNQPAAAATEASTTPTLPVTGLSPDSGSATPSPLSGEAIAAETPAAAVEPSAGVPPSSHQTAAADPPGQPLEPHALPSFQNDANAAGGIMLEVALPATHPGSPDSAESSLVHDLLGGAGPELAVEQQVQDEELSRRLGELFERLSQATKGSKDVELAPLLYSVAAQAATTHEEFEDYLDRLIDVGLSDLSIECALRSMSDSVKDPGNLARNSNFVTMALERIMGLFRVHGERAKRLREILDSAINYFNDGHLGSAGAIMAVADRLLQTSDLDPGFAQRLRSDAVRGLDTDRLKEFARDSSKHQQLRDFLSLFAEYRIDSLMRALLKEGDRDRRLLLLSLLSAHGPDARNLAARMLLRSLENSEPWPWFFVRNLIYLLRKIPPVGDLSETEVAAVVQYSRPTLQSQLVSEAAAYMTDLNVLVGLDVLLHRLALLQMRLGEGFDEETGPREIEVARGLLSQLLRSEGNKARNKALELTLVHEAWPELYGPALAALGDLNLQSDPAAQERLIAVGYEMSRAKSGPSLVPERRRLALEHLLSALSGTPTQPVLRLLETLAADRDLGGLAEVARKSAEELEPRQAHLQPDESTCDLAGNLSVFGLTQLLQWLADTQVTGALHLDGGSDDDEKRQNGEKRQDGVVILTEGDLLDCRFDGKRGEAAFLWMLIEPRFSHFRFVTSHEPISGSARAVRPLLLESVRRADEWERLRRLIKPELRIKSAGRQPSLPRGERRADQVEQVWLGLTIDRLTVGEVEKKTGFDPYRIRRMIAFWVSRREATAAL